MSTKKSIEQQEQEIRARILALEAKKKALAAKKDARRTKRLILLGVLLENSLIKTPKNKPFFRQMAQALYGNRPSDLKILMDFFEENAQPKPLSSQNSVAS